VALLAVAGVEGIADTAQVGGEDALPVPFNPLTHFAQDFNRRRGDGAIRARADVEQIIAAAGRAVDEIAHDRPGILPVQIRPLIAPAFVDRHARFPGALDAGIADGLFWSAVISGEFIAIVHDNLRLQG